MIRSSKDLHLGAAILSERDLAPAVLAIVTDVWAAMASVWEDGTEKSREEEDRGSDAIVNESALITSLLPN